MIHIQYSLYNSWTEFTGELFLKSRLYNYYLDYIKLNIIQMLMFAVF